MKDQEYTLSILKMVINNDLENHHVETSQDLEHLESKRDQLVWEIATKIYTYSGHKVELSMVRDLVTIHLKRKRRQFSTAKLLERQERQPQPKPPIRSNVDSVRWIFLKTCSIICNYTDVNAHRVSMASRIADFADEKELTQILRDLEEVFEIKFPHQATTQIKTVKHLVDVIGYQIKLHSDYQPAANYESAIAI
ncbi:hypothetical protein [Acaryochloris sp. CCMEE 5410]|uniref:hypothetical protein n=1 Tax=Acaryochloris sp. CCMEE 5410 TaxID=310037 RepID=UPI0002483917|nr:hypothetical protein [Acaryochloris sp. CCMEE 5410]KAI9134228.1 hypothetical protein ON05_013710 [Acaryochloris sp. CCMEE 5410]